MHEGLWFVAGLIVGGVVGAMFVFVMAACMVSSKQSREEERRA